MTTAEEMGVTYHEENGYLVPNLKMPEQPEVHLGKYAELRLQYLKKHCRVLYINLKTSAKLTEHLAEIEEQAREMEHRLIEQMAKAEGVTESMKSSDQLKWVGLMNNFKHSAQEIVLNDLIYS